jgi:hypothetical protein
MGQKKSKRPKVDTAPRVRPQPSALKVDQARQLSWPFSAMGNARSFQALRPKQEPGDARGETIDPPVAGINKVGFIDSSDGSNIRTGPRESGGQLVRDIPLPPATRVFASGTHPATGDWWYVTAFLDAEIVRGYVQGLRVNTDLPEPTAKLYQIESGDTVEDLAVREFLDAVRDGHDLRYYENVLLYVNKQKARAGITGSYQDPGLLSGSDNIRLEAGRRIWLVSPAYARAVEGVVPDGSLTNGAVAKVKRFLGHIEDIMLSVIDSPNHLGEVAGEYAQAIRDNAVEIVGIVAAFVAAEALSMFLAATPTGVGQIAAVVIQLGLAAFGAYGMVTAGVEALGHAREWLKLAWTASGDPDKISAASREFVKMLVSIAMAALAYLGVKGNLARAVKVAKAVPFPTPAFAVAGGGRIGSTGAFEAVKLGPPNPAVVAGPMAMVAKVDKSRPPSPPAEGPHGARPRGSKSRFTADEIAAEGPKMGEELEEGLSTVDKAGKSQPRQFAFGNLAHKYLEEFRAKLTTKQIPKEFAKEVKTGELITLDKMPNGLEAEVKIGLHARVDRIGNVIYEVKPNTAASIKNGLEEAREYAHRANRLRFRGRTDWTAKVVVYDAAEAAKYVP